MNGSNKKKKRAVIKKLPPLAPKPRVSEGLKRKLEYTVRLMLAKAQDDAASEERGALVQLTLKKNHKRSHRQAILILFDELAPEYDLRRDMLLEDSNTQLFVKI